MFHGLFPLLIVVIVIIAAASIVKAVLRQRTREAHDYPYEKEHGLFSPAERSFLGVLEQAVTGRYRFMGKVRLADIVKVKSGLNKSSWQNAFNRIQSKHVDLVACDPVTLGIRFVVELDDSTHSHSQRQNRDRFVDKTLEAAGIPIVHVTAKRGYTVQDIQAVLTQAGVLPKT